MREESQPPGIAATAIGTVKAHSRYPVTSAARLVSEAPAMLMKSGTLTSATMMQKPTSRLTPFAAATLRLEKIPRLRMGSLIRRCDIRKITKTAAAPTTQ